MDNPFKRFEGLSDEHQENILEGFRFAIKLLREDPKIQDRYQHYATFLARDLEKLVKEKK